MKKRIVTTLILQLLLIGHINSQEILFDDFETYPLDPDFNTVNVDHWSGLGGNNDGGATIVTEYVYSGEQSMKCDDEPQGTFPCEIKLLLGDKETGVYTLSWQIIITNTGDLVGAITFLDLESSEDFFESGPLISLGAGSSGYIGNGIDQFFFDYQLNKWFLMESVIDLDNNELSYYLDGDLLGVLKYSSSFYGFGENNISHLGSINFSGGINGHPFYIDDVKYSEGILLSNDNKFKKSNEIKIYPNPSTDKIYIDNEAIKEGVIFRLIDVRGNMLDQEKLQGKMIEYSTRDLLAGTYFCQFIFDSGVVATEKIFIQK